MGDRKSAVNEVIIDLSVSHSETTYGQWCPKCSFPSAVEIVANGTTMDGSGVRPACRASFLYCIDHEGFIDPEARD